MAHTSPQVRIVRDVRYELSYPADQAPATVELRDMKVVKDSGPQIFVEKEKQYDPRTA